jgi:DNA repair protein SbcC/Rad50
MIHATAVERKLRTRYGDLERIADRVFRAVDKYAGRKYAIRYFDLTDDLIGKADQLRKYQEEILSDTYFSGEALTDLRWNHYLYFVTSVAASQSTKFAHAKAKVEADREYARKIVILEKELDSLLTEPPASSQAMPGDLASMWMSRLEEKSLAYVLDDAVTVPEAARLIASGHKQKAKKIIAPLPLTRAEQAAARCFLSGLTISGFRAYPQQKSFGFGTVNLIVGSNGTGKTSLLEAIEFLFCGHTRRPGDVMTRTSVSADLVSSGEKLLTWMRTERKQLRARHSHWYAKTDLKKVTLSESFGKFNFLDTDAAVHLSVDVTEERIGRDVMCLLLGSGAERLNDRLQRLRDKLEEFAKERVREAIIDGQLLIATRQRLVALRKAPQMSDALFAELCAALKRLDWRVPPAIKQEAATLRESLQVALTATHILVYSSIDVLATDERVLLERRAEVLEAMKSATKLEEQLKAASLSLAQANRNQTNLRAQLAALDALLPYAEAEYSKNAAEMRELRQRVDSLTSHLSAFGEVDVGADLSDVLGLPIGTAAATASAVLTEQDKRLADSRRALKAMEDTQATVSVLHQRLLKAAQELLRRVPNPDHCPVCHTEFEAGQLQTRMLFGIMGASESRLAEIQTAVLSAEEELARRQQRSTALSRLVAFVGNQTGVTVGEAVESVERARQSLVLERTRLADLEARLQVLATSGLREEELTKHLKVAGLDRLVEVSDLSMRKDNTAKKLEQEVRAEQSAKNALEAVSSVCEQLASGFGVDISVTPEQLTKQLRTQASGLDATVKARGDLTTLLDLKSKALEALAVQLELAQSHLQKLITALAKESADVGAAAAEENSIAKLEGQIRTANNEMKRLQEASTLLDELIKQGVGGELASQILSENATAIGQIFAAIHAPNEFEVKAEQEKLVIVRRETGRSVNLSEMSSGQRAAYALSLFLAMNGRLMSGPRVLLFDDPIAHVDDMNVLSFLDHLRTLAIKGTRQIFFATADAKVAGLFRQKFRFLGDEDFREIALTRV